MEIERIELKNSVRCGYVILLKIGMEGFLPVHESRIREFYDAQIDVCMRWARDDLGQSLLFDYEKLEDTSQKAQFRPQSYRFRMRPCYEDDTLIAFLCESALTGSWNGVANGYFRMAHVWNKEEQLLLPTQQILRYVGPQLSGRDLPFQPDGVYPEGQELVLFRNVTTRFPFAEKKLAFQREIIEKGCPGATKET